MEIRQMEIPRIGEKYTIKTNSGNRAIIIFHRSGKREFYFMDEKQEEPELSLELMDEEARVLGALLLGIDYSREESAPRTDALHDNILVEWFDITEDSCIVNQSIAEAEIRTTTGVTVIGVERGGNTIDSPDIHEKLRAGDRIMVTGTEEDIENFEEMCQGEKNDRS